MPPGRSCFAHPPASYRPSTSRHYRSDRLVCLPATAPFANVQPHPRPTHRPSLSTAMLPAQLCTKCSPRRSLYACLDMRPTAIAADTKRPLPPPVSSCAPPEASLGKSRLAPGRPRRTHTLQLRPTPLPGSVERMLSVCQHTAAGGMQGIRWHLTWQARRSSLSLDQGRCPAPTWRSELQLWHSGSARACECARGAATLPKTTRLLHCAPDRWGANHLTVEVAFV